MGYLYEKFFNDDEECLKGFFHIIILRDYFRLGFGIGIKHRLVFRSFDFSKLLDI